MVLILEENKKKGMWTRMIELICYLHVLMVLFGFLINEIPDGDLPMTQNDKSRHEGMLCFYVTWLFVICIWLVWCYRWITWLLWYKVTSSNGMLIYM